jgi:hypothetical protein
MAICHGAFCFDHAALAFRTWGVLKSSWGVLVLAMGRSDSPTSLIHHGAVESLCVHWPLDTHKDHLMSMAAAIKAAQLAKITPEIYFQEQDIQSRGFPVSYFVDVTKYTERRRELISIYKSQNGPAIAERKISTSKANGLRIWGSRGRYAEVFGVFPGTVPPGKGIFDSMPDVYR